MLPSRLRVQKQRDKLHVEHKDLTKRKDEATDDGIMIHIQDAHQYKHVVYSHVEIILGVSIPLGQSHRITESDSPQLCICTLTLTLRWIFIV